MPLIAGRRVSCPIHAAHTPVGHMASVALGSVFTPNSGSGTPGTSPAHTRVTLWVQLSSASLQAHRWIWRAWKPLMCSRQKGQAAGRVVCMLTTRSAHPAHSGC